MGIGEDIAVFADDEAGAEVQILACRLVFRHIGHIRDKAFEKLVKRVVVRKLAQIHTLLFRLPAAYGASRGRSLDIDHRLTFILHQLCEIGQQHADTAVVFGRFDSLYDSSLLLSPPKKLLILSQPPKASAEAVIKAK